MVDAHICAALGFEARQRLARLLDWGVQVQKGNVISVTNWTSEHNRSMPALLSNLAMVARLLSVAPSELHARLARNALEDPVAEVRLRNLTYLVAPETRTPPELVARTVLGLFGDVHLPVRRLAAEHAGVHGHAVLRAMAADSTIELAARMKAALGLARPPLPDIEGLRALLTESQEPMLVYAALSGIDAAIDAGAGAALFEAVLRCAESEHEAVRAAAARALGVVAQPRGELVLMRLLSDASSDVQEASAHALGAFGSVAAVEPLLPLAQSLVRQRVRQAARGAIGRIQSRLGGAEAGQLSLSDPYDLAGAVDVADTSANIRVGALSLAEEQAAGRARARGHQVEAGQTDEDEAGASNREERARARRARQGDE